MAGGLSAAIIACPADARSYRCLQFGTHVSAVCRRHLLVHWLERIQSHQQAAQFAVGWIVAIEGDGVNEVRCLRVHPQSARSEKSVLAIPADEDQKAERRDAEVAT